MNTVWDLTAKKSVPGRFGWKAEQPSVSQQCAAAFNGDMGLVTSLIPNENYTSYEYACTNLPSGGSPEVSDEIFESVVVYSRALAVPARRDWTNSIVVHGQQLFTQMNCTACHVPELETGEVADFPEFSHQIIHPYTDLLLHDMGEGLSDHRPVFEASGSEWRTPPLWGIGLVEKVNGHTSFLHDGRARNFAEAVLWHEGEAEISKERFRKLSESDRESVIRFLESL
jgi:CxxC motif-containing protein (DUF1111 family)